MEKHCSRLDADMEAKRRISLDKGCTSNWSEIGTKEDLIGVLQRKYVKGAFGARVPDL